MEESGMSGSVAESQSVSYPESSGVSETVVNEPIQGSNTESVQSNPDDSGIDSSSQPDVGNGEPESHDDSKNESTDDTVHEVIEYALNLPEGFHEDAESMNSFKKLLSENGVSSELAQKLLDMHFSQINAESQRYSDYMDYQRNLYNEQVGQLMYDWANEIKNDPDIGGPRLRDNLINATHVINKFGGEDFANLLVSTGLDTNPEMVRFLVSIGKEFAEDTWADASRRGVPSSHSVDDVAKTLFSNSLA